MALMPVDSDVAERRKQIEVIVWNSCWALKALKLTIKKCVLIGEKHGFWSNLGSLSGSVKSASIAVLQFEMVNFADG